MSPGPEPARRAQVGFGDDRHPVRAGLRPHPCVGGVDGRAVPCSTVLRHTSPARALSEPQSVSRRAGEQENTGEGTGSEDSGAGKVGPLSPGGTP
ncbi:hypothetical protein SHIRM173S_01286 [Streptomyces hirsutus]